MKKRSKTAPQTAAKLSQHISELRWRFFAVLLFFAIGGGITYVFREQVFMLLQLPLEMPLYYTTPAGSFSLVLRFCAIGAAMAAIPMVAYQIIMFIRPAFSASISRLRVYVTSVASLFLGLAGMAFGFTVILPASLHFFAGFQMEGLESIISADSYLTLVTNILITFALAFQLPLIISFIDHIKPLRPKQLFKMEKWVILGSLIVSTFVPFAWDLATSLLIAAPIVVLYNIAILAVLLQHMASKSKKHHANVRKSVTRSESKKTTVYEQPAAQRIPSPALSTVATVKPTQAVKLQSPRRPMPRSMDILPSTKRTAPPRLASPQVSAPKLRTIQPAANERLISDFLRRPHTA